MHFDHNVAGGQSGLHNTLDTGHMEPMQHIEMHHFHH
jgi:hypothetical protein